MLVRVIDDVGAAVVMSMMRGHAGSAGSMSALVGIVCVWVDGDCGGFWVSGILLFTTASHSVLDNIKHRETG